MDDDRLDEMKDRLELWVLRAASNDIDPSPLRGLLHLSVEQSPAVREVIARSIDRVSGVRRTPPPDLGGSLPPR